jgi:hypothetical protein
MRAAVLVLVLLVAGCARSNAGTPVPDERVMPADFAGVVEYRNGSVAPPHHYEWRLRFDGTTAVVEWRPGYDDTTPPWREAVDITDDQRRHLYGRLHDLGVFTMAKPVDEGLVGGPTGSVEATAGGKTYGGSGLGQDEASTDLLADVVAAVEELVPAEVWDGLTARQDAWGERQPK